MAIKLTPHGVRDRDAGDHIVDALAAQIGDAIAVADGAVSAALAGGLYRIKASTACVVRIGGTSLDNRHREMKRWTALPYRWISRQKDRGWVEIPDPA